MIDFMPMLSPTIVWTVFGVAVALIILCSISKKLRNVANYRRISIVFVVFLILLRPVLPNGTESTEKNNINVFLVVDSSSSMSANDANGMRRFERVKRDISNIADELMGSQYSIITLDSMIHTTMPLSSNNDLLKTSTEMILPANSSYSDGTNLNELLETTEEHIKNYSKTRSDAINVLFIFSDGEDTTNTLMHVNPSFKNIIFGGAVFGYGSQNGSTMDNYINHKWGECIEYTGNDPKVKTINKCAISSINEVSLKEIAKSLNLNYYHRMSDEIPIEVINNIKTNAKYNADSTIDSYIDIYWIFAIVAICLLLWEFADSFYKILLERTKDGGA